MVIFFGLLLFSLTVNSYYSSTNESDPNLEELFILENEWYPFEILCWYCETKFSDPKSSYSILYESRVHIGGSSDHIHPTCKHELLQSLKIKSITPNSLERFV